jgi:mono/diheme cytochrome c family protein
MTRPRAWLVPLASTTVLGGLLVGFAAWSFAGRGLGTRAEPSWIEVVMAGAARRLATPGAVRALKNPVEPTQPVLDEARSHFADHCASCHANDGSGDTALGRNFYPKAPDMRVAGTQALTDGELFTIIENGIRLTGMPAWGTGTPEGEQDSWALVHFIRRLPALTPAEIEAMEAYNPKTPAEFREAEEARRFLAGDDTPPAEPVAPSTGHVH